MKLTDSQTATVTEWVEAGAELGEIQSRLKQEFDLSLTYLDTRFLIGDLGLTLLSEREVEEEEEVEAEKTDDASEATPPEGDSEAAADGEDTPPEPEAGGGSVSVAVDTIAQPHAIVSGQVTFSDGETAAWYFDQMGRLGLDPANPDSTPSEADIAAFQMELQEVLRKQGM